MTGPDAPSALENFLDLHARKVVIGLGVLLGIVAVATTIHLKKRNFEKEAGAALVAAADMDALKKVVGDYEGTPAARTAKLLLADRQLDAGDAQAAAETLRAFIASDADHPLVSQARLALANALLRQGKPDEANAELATFLTASPTSPLAPLALMQQAELAEQKGDLEGARKLYEQVTAGFPESQFARLISQEDRAKRVGFVMPTEVEPPPPPAPPAGESPAAPGQPAAPAGQAGGSILDGEGPIPVPGAMPPPTTPLPPPSVESESAPTPEAAAPAAPESSGSAPVPEGGQ